MNRRILVLLLLTFVLALLQFSVFSAWAWGGTSPQIWLAVTFFLYLSFSDSGNSAFWFLLLYFIFYDVLILARPAFAESLFLIAGLSVFKGLIGRFLGKKILAAAVLFLWLNLLSFLYLNFGRGFDLTSFTRQLFVNLVFYLPSYPLLCLAKFWLFRNEKPQLSFKV